MEDENEYKKLPTEDKCIHKLWKARLAGYEEAIKLFNSIDDEKSPEWNKFLGLIKKFVTDSNAVAQERGLEAALVFVENCGHAGKTAGEVMSGIVAKCIAAPKTKTKDLALQVTLMYVEIEKHEVVQEELMKGMEQKNPKVVSASTASLTTALKLFGNKVITIKPMVKKIPVLLADRDKGVRDEMKALVVEMHRWIGAAIEPHIASLQPVVQQELRAGFTSGGAAQPERWLRSQQQRQPPPAQHAAGGDVEDEEAELGGGDCVDVDPFDFMEPVEIISRLPKDFFDKVEAKKWQERKEALDAVENLLKTAPRLAHGDYADLVRALKKVVSKDSNVVLVALGTRLLGSVASGLRQKFSPYATACIQAVLEKFKEKKPNVVTALRDTADAIYPSTNLEAIMEDMLAAFENKNPSIKAESAHFLARALSRTQPANFGKKILKAYVGGLLKLLESADPSVRDAAAEALGTAQRLLGERALAPHLPRLDPLKEAKLKEAAERAVIQVKVPAAKSEAKPKAAPKADAKPAAGSAQPKPVKRPAGSAKKPAGAAVKKPATASPPREPDLSPEEVDARAADLLPNDVLTGLSDSNWKTRLSAVQSYQTLVQGLTPGDASAQLLLKILNRKPGLKDTNVQVLKARVESAKYIAENFTVSTAAMECVLQDIVTKLGEASCSSLCALCLTALAAGCGLGEVANAALGYAMDEQKSPKVQAEVLTWLGASLAEFGLAINVKSVIPHLKKALSATNPLVRSSAVGLIGLLSLHAGPGIQSHFDGEKPATKQLISLECDKYANSTPPTPTRQKNDIAKSASKGSLGDDLSEEAYEESGGVEEEAAAEAAAAAAAAAEDARPRADLAPLVTDALLAEINDKNWKVRNEGLEKLKALIASSAPIKASLGELPGALTARLLDSNSKLAQAALQICESLAMAMGARCKQHVRTFFPAFFQAFGDNKPYIRAAAVSCVETWCTQCGPAAALEADMAGEALAAGAPLLRLTLLTWLARHMPTVPPKAARDDLLSLLPPLYAALEDRAADVRRAAADCVLPVMLHLNYEPMAKQMDKLKPGSKAVVQAALDKARPFLPIQPLPTTKGKKEDPKAAKTAKKEGEKKIAVKGKAPAKPSARGKKDEEDTTPLLPTNNAKNQRIIDDQKLKVLKWNFTTPREEFFELLKEQMTSAGLNKQLVANMFHADFRYHLKAIEALQDDLTDNPGALVANLDLVLKWLTLRFYDTNPSVLLKGLEYLATVFHILIDEGYTLAEYEAHCFIPYLVIKVGDPKDAVRAGVKALFKQIIVVYSAAKLLTYLMEGLKSKNARQRAECLECIGELVESSSGGVLPGGAAGAAALRELARHIGDRDNAVRSAALNAVAAAYFILGEKVYKMIGQLSDKDLSLLEERIKRATKTRSAEVRRSIPPATRPPPEEEGPKRVITVETPPGADYDDDEDEDPPEPEMPAPAPPPAAPAVRGPFGLDPELIARLDAGVPRAARAPLPTPDLHFLDEPVPRPALPQPARPPAAAHSVPLTPPRAPALGSLGGPGLGGLPSMGGAPSAIDDSKLMDTIHSIASPDLNAAIRALSLVSGSLVSGRGAALAAHEDRFVAAVAAQVARLRQQPPNLDAYKYIAGALTAFYETGGCGTQVGAESLGALLAELLLVLGGRAVGGGGAGAGAGAERLVRLLNNVCVKLLEHSPRTALLCAIITLLHESIDRSDPEYPRYQELLLKCFWKTLKMINSWQVDELDYGAVMLRVHRFYQAYPTSYWKRNPQVSDTPYRTVKTLIHTLVKIKGTSITDDLGQIPDINESEVYPYLLKVFKQLKLEDKKENTPEFPAQGGGGGGRLPRAVHDQLAAILAKIGNRQNSDALTELYDLRERHPEVDIWTYMQSSSFYFRNYVERGLREVAEQRRATLYRRPENIDITNDNEEKSHVIFLEKLRALQAKAGLKTEGLARSPGERADLANENLARGTLDPQLELNTTQAISMRNDSNMDALRLKLQQIKSSSKR